MLEPLTKRELEVLKLLAEGMTNRQIGQQLFIGAETVKGHNKNIYSKLGVNRRLDAIEKAKELNLTS